MTNRIILIHPWGSDSMNQASKDAVAPFVRPDTEIAVTNLGAEASPDPWPKPESLDSMIEVARRAEQDGFDAIVIACCADPFLHDVRAAVGIPVVGLTETVCQMAKEGGARKLALFVRELNDSYKPYIPRNGSAGFEYWSERLQSYGLAESDFVLRTIKVPTHPEPDDLRRLTKEDPDTLRDLTIQAMTDSIYADGLVQSRAAVADDGADMLYFACQFWSPGVGGLGAAASAFKAPVVNPLVAGVQQAERLLEERARRRDAGASAAPRHR